MVPGVHFYHWALLAQQDPKETNIVITKLRGAYDKRFAIYHFSSLSLGSWSAPQASWTLQAYKGNFNQYILKNLEGKYFMPRYLCTLTTSWTIFTCLTLQNKYHWLLDLSIILEAKQKNILWTYISTICAVLAIVSR